MTVTAESTIAGQLAPGLQEQMVADVRAIVGEAPLVRPVTPGGKPMGVRVSGAGRYGWVGDGEYRYSPTQASGKPWPPIPKWWRVIATRVAPDVGEAEWDSAIVNWYEPGSRLGWHQDKAEADTSRDIVTISLGDDAVWAVRELGGRPSRAVLTSGAITVLGGPSRALEHTIMKILRNCVSSPLSRDGRISVTMRVAGAE